MSEFSYYKDLYTLITMTQITPQEQQYLIHLSNVTYRSHNSEQIAAATTEFKAFVVLRSPKSFYKLQQLIAKQQQLPLDTRKALISLYKVSVDHMKNVLQNQSRHNEDIYASQKQFLHVVEHAFNNRNIETSIKYPISQSYVNLFMFFNPDNFERLMTNSKYYFNIKDDVLALDMLQIYHQMDSPFKFKVEFYGPCIRTLMEYLAKKLDILYNSQPLEDMAFMAIFKKHINLLRDIWCSLTFQLYEIAFDDQFKDPTTAKVLQMMTGIAFPEQFHIHFFQIAEHIISGLMRTHLVYDNEGIAQILSQLAKRQFNNLMKNNVLQQKFPYSIQALIYAKINFLVACSDSTFTELPLVEFKPSIFDIYTKLIYPHYKATQKYLNQHSDNATQISDFLADLTYDMRSECKQTILHKLIITICRSSSQIRSNMRQVICGFLFEYLPRITNHEIQPIKSHLFTNEAVVFWEKINKELNSKDMIMSVLHFIALAPELFLSDFEFLNVFNEFMGTNSDFLLMKDPQVCFYIMLIYRNYKEDIFADNKSSKFTSGIVNIALRSQNNIMKQFGLIILKQHLEQKPPYDSLYLTVMHIFEILSIKMEQRLLPLVYVIFKNYPNQIGRIKQIVPLMERVIESFTNKVIRHNQPIQESTVYFDIFQQFMEIKELASLLPKIIIEILIIMSNMSNRNQVDGDQFLFLLVKGLNKLGELPPNTESLLMEFKWQFEDITVVNSFTRLIKYTRNEDFINWLFSIVIQRDFTISNCLLIHSIIYYQMQRLNPNHFKYLFDKIYYTRMINRASINYINGKLNIILLLILKFDRKLFYSFLQRQDWIPLQEKVWQEIKTLEVLQKNKSEPLPFIDQIFRLMYVSEYAYSWKYDKEVFLILQIKNLMNNLGDQYQLKYANVSFVAVTKNILRCYEIVTNEIELQEPQSQDEDIFPAKQYDQEQLNHLRILSKFQMPAQFRQDYFELYRILVQKLKSTPSSNQWMKTIFEKVFDHQDRYHLEQILSVKKIQSGKFRKIIKVK